MRESALGYAALNVDHYRPLINGEKVFDSEKTFIRAWKKPDNPVKGTLPYFNGISIFFNDVIDKNCRQISFGRNDALEIARKIIDFFEPKQTEGATK
jgi:hypothetical protein